MAKINNKPFRYAFNFFLGLMALAPLACFSTPAQAAGVEVQKAPIKLQLGSSDEQGWRVNNIAPGMTGTQTVQVSNTGGQDAKVTMWVSNVQCTRSATSSDPGQLDRNLYLAPSCVGLSTNILLPATVNSLPQSSTDPRYIKIDPVSAGQTVNIAWAWSVPPTVGNEIQGNVLSFDINYLMEMQLSCVGILGTDVLEGSERPFAGHNVPLTLKLFNRDTVINSSNVLTLQPLYTFSTVDETLAIVSIDVTSHSIIWVGPCVPPDYYNVTIVSSHTLINIKHAVPMFVDGMMIDLGRLIDGNPNNDVQIAGADMSLLLNDYLSVPGSSKWNNGRCDFDRNGQVNSIDYSILVANYNKFSPISVD